MSWATWLLSLVQPLIAQALLALGVGVVTVAGISLVVDKLMSWVVGAVGGLPADLMNLLAMGGVFQGMGYIGGAISARVAMAGAANFKRFFVK